MELSCKRLKVADFDILNTFWLMCRDRFKVLERYHRASKKLELTPKPAIINMAEKRNSNVEVPGTPKAKRVRITVLNCSSKMPVRKLRWSNPDKLPCWICGYNIQTKKCIEFKCCDQGKVSHLLCWRKQNDSVVDVMCSNVKHYFNRAAKAPDYNVVFSSVEKPKTTRAETASNKLIAMGDKLYCSTCEEHIDPNSITAKDHLKFECKAIPCSPLKPGFDRQSLARRMAALGSKKKLHNHNFTPH